MNTDDRNDEDRITPGGDVRSGSEAQGRGLSTDADQDEVARRAYERYQARGGAHGDDQADWYEAERQVRESGGTRARDPRPAGAIDPGAREDRSETSTTAGGATRGRGVEGAPLDEDSARTSGTGPTSSPTGTGPGGNVRTPGTAVSGGPTEGGR